MANLNFEKYTIHIILVIIGLFIIALLFSLIKTHKKEYRISKFSLNSLENKQKSLADFLLDFCWIFIRKLSDLINKSKLVSKRSTKYEKYLEFKNSHISKPTDFIIIKFLLGVLLIICYITLSYLTFEETNPIFTIIFFFIGYFVPNLYLNAKFKFKQKMIENDLLSAVIIMNNAFKSGQNITQAVKLVGKELTGPIADEFNKIHQDLCYGLDFEKAFNRFSKRINLEDAKYISSSITIINKTGGSTTKMFNSIEKQIYERKTLRNELKSMTAASVLVYRTLVIMPIIIILAITFLNPDFFKPLYQTLIGIITMSIIIIIYLLYIYTVKKALKVDIS